MIKKITSWLLISLLSIGFTVLAQEYLIIEQEQVKLRKDPSGTIITDLPTDKQMEVVATAGDWVKVKGKVEVEGWIPKDETSLAEDDTETTDKTEIKGGFTCNNIHFTNRNGLIEVNGEISNHSGKRYHIATFTITLYGNQNQKIGQGYINIGNFTDGETEDFSAVINGKFSSIQDYKIRFQNE
ncbi:hypothetical protein JCM16358_07980 [Halanaerocella petrolearia]